MQWIKANRSIVHIEKNDNDDCLLLQMSIKDVVMAFNILCYIKEDDKVIQRIYELLKPGGVFVSTTDCRGDKMILMNILMSLCSKLRLIPFMRFYKIGDLEENIKRNGFKILETQNLHHGMPNYFIAAMK